MMRLRKNTLKGSINMLQYFKLTPAFQRWNDKVPVTQVDDWIGYRAYTARVDQALCFIDRLWPEFVEVEGLVLRKNAIPKDWNEYVRQAREKNLTSRNIEYLINHLHVSDMFLNDPDRDNVNGVVYTFLANTMADMWRSRLTESFPHKRFSVGVDFEQVDPEVYAYTMDAE
jgi:hypothetical protein